MNNTLPSEPSHLKGKIISELQTSSMQELLRDRTRSALFVESVSLDLDISLCV